MCVPSSSDGCHNTEREGAVTRAVWGASCLGCAALADVRERFPRISRRGDRKGRRETGGVWQRPPRAVGRVGWKHRRRRGGGGERGSGRVAGTLAEAALTSHGQRPRRGKKDALVVMLVRGAWRGVPKFTRLSEKKPAARDTPERGEPHSSPADAEAADQANAGARALCYGTRELLPAAARCTTCWVAARCLVRYVLLQLPFVYCLNVCVPYMGPTCGVHLAECARRRCRVVAQRRWRRLCMP